MHGILTDHHKAVVLTFILLYFFAGRPAEFGEENLFFQGFPIAKPVIRIALGVNIDDIMIKSSSGMKIYQVEVPTSSFPRTPGKPTFRANATS